MTQTKHTWSSKPFLETSVRPFATQVLARLRTTSVYLQHIAPAAAVAEATAKTAHLAVQP
jgi:hypothetical protein